MDLKSGNSGSELMNEVGKSTNDMKDFDPDKRLNESGEQAESSKSKKLDAYDPDKKIEVSQDSEKIEMNDDEKKTAEVDEEIKEGGSYKEVKANSDGTKEEVHHMPADSASNLERNDGPAIKMEKEDHRQTASCGSSIEAREYQAIQKEKIQNGDFRGAIQMDIDDIRSKFGNKYDKAIEQMLKYVDKLEEAGKI